MISENPKPFVRQFPFKIMGSLILSFLLNLPFGIDYINGWKSYLIGLFWAFSISLTQWVGLEYIYEFIDKHISWIEKPLRKIVVQLGSFLSYSACAYTLMQFLNFYLWRDMDMKSSWPLIVKTLPVTLLIAFVISLIFTAIGFFNAWKRSFIHAEKLKVEMMAYKYESLRNQINPHFLFNSLNVLSDLVYDDQKLAVKFIRQLSDLFRYVLASRDKELVPLADEISFMQSYIFLLKTRFENKLQIELDVNASPDDYIVPMTLQLLVENAVKHNEVSEAYPLKIVIRKTNNCIDVENNLRLKNVGEDSKKTGLRNIIQQFSFFSEEPIKIMSTDDTYKVRIPVLKAVKQ